MDEVFVMRKGTEPQLERCDWYSTTRHRAWFVTACLGIRNYIAVIPACSSPIAISHSQRHRRPQCHRISRALRKQTPVLSPLTQHPAYPQTQIQHG